MKRSREGEPRPAQPSRAPLHGSEGTVQCSDNRIGSMFAVCVCLGVSKLGRQGCICFRDWKMCVCVWVCVCVRGCAGVWFLVWCVCVWGALQLLFSQVRNMN